MHTLDPEKTKAYIKKAGFDSIGAIAEAIGVHRNTLNHFMSGAGVFPQSIDKLFSLLKVEPHELLINAKKTYSPKLVSHIIEALNKEAPECCFVLFGSRATGRERRFSDFDIGIFREAKITFAEYSKLKDIVDSLAEDLPVSVDFVNLTHADSEFLKNIGSNLIFLGGSPVSLGKLEEKINGSKT